MTIDFFPNQKLPETLTAKENIELFKLLLIGDISARDKLISGNICTVYSRVNKKFSMVDYDKDELVSIGIIGLIKAVDTFDVSRGLKFSTYSSRCIDNEILMFIRKLQKDSCLQSLEVPVYKDKDDKEAKLVDILSDDTDFVEDIIETIMRPEEYRIIKELVNNLVGRDKEIVMLYFGFGGKCYTQKEIGDKLGIDKTYVSKLLKGTIKDLRKQYDELMNEEGSKKEQTIVEIQFNEENVVTMDDYQKATELLSLPVYSQMMSTLTVKEAIIISLQLGYIDGKHFSVSSIGKLFGITSEEVIEITKRALLLYRKNIKLFLEHIDKIEADNISRKREINNLE